MKVVGPEAENPCGGNIGDTARRGATSKYGADEAAEAAADAATPGRKP